MGYYSRLNTETIDIKITNMAGRFFFGTSLPGSAWNCLEMIIAELNTRTGAEMSGRFEAENALFKAHWLLEKKQHSAPSAAKYSMTE